jgi:hypothetical protein
MAAAADTAVVGPTRGAERFEGGERWSARPGLARVARLIAYTVPLVLAMASGWMIGRQAFTQPWPTLVRWAAMSAVATAVLIGVECVARRLLPLCALMNLSLVFPDRAPSRFSVALRSGNVKQLEDRAAQDSADAAATILANVMALHAHDRRTRGHSERVRAFAVMIGQELSLPRDQLDRLQWAALLHDIGKLEVPSAILNKDGRPTDEEWSTLQGHPAYGERLIAPLADWLGEWVGAVNEHHERWDGEGYPRGLRGEEISLAGRIVAVADAFEVMTAARSYKKPLSISAARTELTRCAGAQFDPAIVRAFLNVSIGRVRGALSPLAWTTQLPFVPSIAAIPAPGAVAAAGAVVGGLILGPAAPPAVGSEAPATPSSEVGTTTADTRAPASSSASSQAATVHADNSALIPPSQAATSSPVASDRAPGPTSDPPPATPPTTPATTDPGQVGPGAPVLGPVVDPLVDDVVDPLLGPVVNPLVDQVVDPLLGPVVNPLLGHPSP